MILVAVTVMVSCKKKTYPVDTVEGTPVFYFKGNLNSVPVEISSGVNNYYMYSSWTQDANGVYNLMSHLKPNDGSVLNSLQLQINDERVSALNEACLVDEALNNSYYPFKAGNPAPIEYSVQFYPKFDKGFFPTYTWNFGDGTPVSQLASPTHIFKRFKNYNVCLTALSTSNTCSSNLCNNYNSGLPGNNFNSGIAAINDTLTSVQFVHIPKGGTPPYTYFWDFGDGGSTSTLASPTFTYSGDGTYYVTLTVTDSKGFTSTCAYNFATQNSLSCAINYSVITSNPVSNPKELSNIIINWTDASGKVYTSNNGAQPVDSYFEIVSAEPFTDNENGQKTRKVHVRFKCTVYNSSNSSDKITIDGAEAVIAVAFK